MSRCAICLSIYFIRFQREYVRATRRSGRVCVGVFGWIHASGVGELADVGPGRFTGEKYVELLDEVLLPTVRTLLFPNTTPFYLVQDNSPIHTSRVVKDWFREHPHITLLPHPPKSPDLNPIEEIWAAMIKVGRPDTLRQRNRQTLLDNAMMAWEQLRLPEGQNLSQSSVASMPRRLISVLENGGGYTKY